MNRRELMAAVAVATGVSPITRRTGVHCAMCGEPLSTSQTPEQTQIIREAVEQIERANRQFETEVARQLASLKGR
jgi:hypothetical protein